MRLKSIEYSDYEGQPNEWRIEGCTLGDVNLIVGKNATGKTQTLYSILALSKILSGKKFRYGNFEGIFEDNDSEIKYIVHFKNKKIVKEKLIQENETVLERDRDGKGKIFAAQLNTHINFQPPPDELAVVSRRDAIQHPFLDALYQWGMSAKFFPFGTPMGKNHFAVFVSGTDRQEEEFDLNNPDNVVGIFKKGEITYGIEYTRQIIEDMKKIGYEIESLSIGSVETMDTQGKPFIASGFQVKEKDLNAMTPQNLISTGMFRALSLIIQLNYSLLSSLPSCIIIDDIGEGLDYSRSTALIDLLINKAKGTNIQLIMSTNDRFVMNSVPIQYWSVIQRFPGKSVIYNYRNSKEIFDDFEFTGLSNFDFFTSNYFLKDRG